MNKLLTLIKISAEVYNGKVPITKTRAKKRRERIEPSHETKPAHIAKVMSCKVCTIIFY